MDNLAIWQKTSAIWQAIPVAQNPVVVKSSEWNLMVQDARLLLSCFPVVLTWLQRKENQVLWNLIFGELEGVEADAAHRNPSDTWGHATIRLDLFWHGDELKIIEANCTIPAMQAYSDMVLRRRSELLGIPQPSRGNSADLLDSLLALYRRDGGEVARPRIAILHRDGDSQLAELEYFKHHWHDRAEVVLVTPSQWNEQDFDLVYRHIFATRLLDQPKLLAALRDSRRWRIYNPISAHYEIKAFLAMVAVVVSDDWISSDLGLSLNQREAIGRRVPWTRIIPSQRYSVGQDSEIIASDIGFAANAEKYVIKHSSGYGGHFVFVGSEWHEPTTQVRLQNLLKVTEFVSPALFWRWVTTESQDVWVVQQRMSGRRYQSKVLSSGGGGLEIGNYVEAYVDGYVDGYVDASVFLNTGTEPLCGGGVSRFASGPVVNIGTGGGLAPLIIDPSL